MTDSENERMQTIQSFIERCQKELKKEIGDLEVDSKSHTKNLYAKQNKKWNGTEQRIDQQKKYAETEKGKFAAALRNYKYRTMINRKSSDISFEEKILIGRFYKNCPKGYEVDHIIPVSKGGEHSLSNLQYLTREQNRRKANKLDWEFEDGS